MPHDRSRYPADWPEISKRIRFERAGNKCEWCGAANHEPHPVTGGMVTLTVAHWPDPEPSNVDEANLHALCNSCHNKADAPMRARHAAETRLRKKAALQPSLLMEVS
jgi:5-methylcytosine-specific restriction endonuclease McrA